MFKVNLFTFLLVLGMSVQNVYADETSSALQKNQDCLKNQNCDFSKTDVGKMIDQKVFEIAGGNTKRKQELYSLAADVLPTLAQQANGDPTKMQAIMGKAQADPKSFLNSLSPETQTKIKNMAKALKNQAPENTP